MIYHIIQINNHADTNEIVIFYHTLIELQSILNSINMIAMKNI